MLLEYFLSSGTPELSTDAKISTNSNSIISNQLSADNSESFKIALSESIVGRSKYLSNQTDMAYSESGLLDDIQKWDQLYSGDIQEQSSDNEAQKLNINNPIISEENNDVSQTADYIDRFTTGEEVPVDGKPLPVSSLLSNEVTVNEVKKSDASEAIIPGEQKKNDVAISTNENKELKNTEAKIAVATNSDTKITVAAHADTKDIIKESIVISDKNNEPSKLPITAQVNDKAEKTLNIPVTQLKNPDYLVKEISSESKDTVKNLLNEVGKIAVSPPSNPKTATLENIASKISSENIVAKTSTSEKLLSEIKPGNSELTKSVNENIQKTASALLNHEIQKAKTTGFVPVSVKVKSLMPNETKGKQPNLLSQSIPQSQTSNATTVPESLKLEQPSQIENQSAKLNIKELKGNPLAEQFIQQVVKNETLSSSLTNTDTTTQNPSRAPAAISGAESVSHQSQQIQQQINSTQTINRHNDVALSVSMPTPQWNKKFAEHVSMLALKGATSAQIKLDPPELGPLAVKIVHTGSETQVQFQVTNPIARELVDSGMNKLREMLEEHGFDNVDVDVSEQQTNEKHASEEASDLNDIEDKNDELRPHSNKLPEKFINNSLVDLFA